MRNKLNAFFRVCRRLHELTVVYCSDFIIFLSVVANQTMLSRVCTSLVTISRIPIDVYYSLHRVYILNMEPNCSTCTGDSRVGRIRKHLSVRRGWFVVPQRFSADLPLKCFCSCYDADNQKLSYNLVLMHSRICISMRARLLMPLFPLSHSASRKLEIKVENWDLQSCAELCHEMLNRIVRNGHLNR